MAFKDLDKSTPTPFNDKKPNDFIQETPFFDSDLETQVWDDISKLGGKQIAREEIDLIYHAFAEKIASISSEITSLKSSLESNPQKTSDTIDVLVQKSEDLTKNEKEESEKIESSISSIIDLTDITKVDEKSNERSIELDEKFLESIYKKIVKTISSPSILVPFITKISEKIYDSITQSSSKIFNELNKEFKDQLKIDILGDIKDIAKAKEIQTIGNDKLDEEAVKHLAEREKKRQEQEKKEREKKNKDQSKDSKKTKSEIRTKNSEKSETTEIEKIREERHRTSEIDEIEESERRLKEEESSIDLDSDDIKSRTEMLDEVNRKRKNPNNSNNEGEDALTKKSFTSIRDALIATQESLNDSNQKIKKVWDDTLKMNDLEEYSITADKPDGEKKKENKKADDKKKDSKESGFNFGSFALIGALAACYFLFKGYAHQAHIQRYLETHPPIESMQREIGQTVEDGTEELRTGLQKEIDKNLKEGESQQAVRNSPADNQSNENAPVDQKSESQQLVVSEPDSANQPDENIPSDTELDKTIENYGETVSEAIVEKYEASRLEQEAEDAKKIKKQLNDSLEESHKQFEEFQNEYKLKNASLDKEIDKGKKEFQKSSEELQASINDLVDKSKQTEDSVRDYVESEEQRNKYDKKITDSASGLILAETEVLDKQQKEIKAHEQFEQDLVEDQKKKDLQTRKQVEGAFDEIQDEIQGSQKELEAKLKEDPKVAEKVAEVKKQTFNEVERSGLEITDYIDKEFKRIHDDVIKYNQAKDDNDVIEAATTNNKYVIIDMESYQKMLNIILAIGTDALSCDNQVIAKIGHRPLR